MLLGPNTYAQTENPWIEVGFQGDDRYRVLWNSMAKAGDIEAQFNLGLAYSRGERGYNQNHQKALHWLTVAAERNYPPAENNLGVYYALGRGVPVDISKAHFWFNRAFTHDPEGIGYANTERIQQHIAGVDRWSKPSPKIPPSTARFKPNLQSDKEKQVKPPPCPPPRIAKTPTVSEKEKNKENLIVERKTKEKYPPAQTNTTDPTKLKSYELNPHTFVPEHFTLQLAGAHSRDKIVQYIQDGIWDQRVGYISTRRNSKDWFVVVYGDFADTATATRAKQQLMRQSKKSKIWIRSFASITPVQSRQALNTYELNPCTFVPKHFTLQLAGTHSREKVVQYLQDGNWDQKIGYVSTKRDSNDWFVAIYGDFANKAAASKAKQQLMNQSKKLKIWARSFASLTQAHRCHSVLSTVDSSEIRVGEGISRVRATYSLEN